MASRMTVSFRFAIATSLLLSSLTGARAEDDPHPIASTGNFELHPDLELTLFAREPDVVDPVALTFDEFGRAYVVEMRDYPYGFGPDRQPGGSVRQLEDLDGDGRVDGALSLPTASPFHVHRRVERGVW
jgi:hypothetical protein